MANFNVLVLYEVLASSDQSCEDLGFLVYCIDSFNALLFCDFGC